MIIVTYFEKEYFVFLRFVSNLKQMAEKFQSITWHLSDLFKWSICQKWFQVSTTDASRRDTISIPRYFRTHSADRSYRYDLHNIHKQHLDSVIVLKCICGVTHAYNGALLTLFMNNNKNIFVDACKFLLIYQFSTTISTSIHKTCERAKQRILYKFTFINLYWFYYVSLLFSRTFPEVIARRNIWKLLEEKRRNIRGKCENTTRWKRR